MTKLISSVKEIGLHVQVTSNEMCLWTRAAPTWNKTVAPAPSEEPASSEAWGAPLVDRLSFWQSLTDGGQEGAIMRLDRGMDTILTILQVPHVSAMAPLPIASHDPADSRADAWIVIRERKSQ